MTGFDGQLTAFFLHPWFLTIATDYLQYTITSRKEMPNAEFVQEIAKAAEDLYNLHSSIKNRRAQL